MGQFTIPTIRRHQQLHSGRRRCAGICIALLLVMFVLPRKSFAQVLYGSLTGTVTDPSGAPVPDAKVEALNAGTGVAQQDITDSRGMYRFTHLQPGTYRLTVSAPSFQTRIQQNIQLNTNTELRVDAQLQLARVSQTVTVNAPPVALQTQRADVRSLLSSSQVSNLPLGQDRNFQTLFKLVPGVSPPFPSHSYAANPTGGLAMQANGQGVTTNGMMIDGTPNPNYWEENIIAYVPPADAIESVDIVTSNFDAEQGQASGVISNVVIKSGTNTFHGAAWEYHTNSALQARNFFYYGASIPKNIVNQFGLDLGGPIIKNKLFFFGDWERYRLSQNVNTIQSIPTAPIREGDFTAVSTTLYDPATGNPDGSGRTQIYATNNAADTAHYSSLCAAAVCLNMIPTSRLSSAAQKMTALIPMPNYGTGGIANNYFSSGDLLFHRDSVDLKINYNPSDKSTVFGRYSAEPTFVFDPQVLGPAGGNAVGPTSQPGNAFGLTQSATIAGTYTFTPNLLWDANVGFTRQALTAENTDIDKNYGSDVLGIPGTNGPTRFQGGFPPLYISGFASLGNPSIYNPFFFWDNEYLFGTNLSWARGPHSFRFGFSYTRAQLNHIQPQVAWGPRGGFSFSGGVTALKGGTAPNAYNSWAAFMLGQADSFGKDLQYLSPDTLRESTYSFYARDIWQVTSKLSVNYGIRYEYQPYATHDHFGGLNYDPNTNLTYIGGMGGVPSNAYVDVGSGQVVPRLGVAYRITDRTVVRAGFGMTTDPERYEDTINFYPATISEQFTAPNSYAPAGSLDAGIPAFTGPDISKGKIALPSNVGTAAYTMKINRGYIVSYNFTVQRNMGAGFDAQLAYVGNHGVRLLAVQNINAAGPGEGVAGGLIDQLWGNPNSIGLNTPFNGGNYNALQAQLKRRVHGAEMGIAYTYSKAIDYTDAETSGLTWNWVPMLGRNRALAGFDQTHNFQLWAVYGLPFGQGQRWVEQGVGGAILGGWTFSPILSRMSGTPFTVTSSGASLDAPHNTQTADQVLSNVAILGGHGPNQPYFDPNAFAPVTAVRFGATGRNILRGPGSFSLDASLARTFTLHESFKLQFRADAFSLTNTPNFGNPGANVSSAKFVNGSVQSYNGYDIITSASGQRQIRFALVLSF
jgi:Carboxypeptidase regulatory-like domain/TonB dependent receptor-like, beta-barrel